MTSQQALELALRHHQAGRLAEAEALYRQILAVEPLHGDALHLLGVIAHQVGRHAVAVKLISQAIAIQPTHAEAHNNLANSLQSIGQLEQAIVSYRQAILHRPEYAEAHDNLGTALRDIGRLDEAIASFRRAIALQSRRAEAYRNLGIAFRDKGHFCDATDAFRQAIALNPNYAEAHRNLGAILSENGHCEEAIAACRQGVALQSNDPEAYYELGNALRASEQFDEAIAAFRQTIALKPHHAKAHCNLGVCIKATGQLDEAIAALRRAIALDPNLSEAYNNLGVALKDEGQAEEAIAAFRRAVQLKPDNAGMHSNLIFALHFQWSRDIGAIREEQHRWHQQFAEPVQELRRDCGNDREPDRRLRIGYVSPDFCEHSVAYFIEGLFGCHDRGKVEVFCYSNVARPDAVTTRLRRLVSQWREIATMPDARAAQLIRDDKIDILVDLAGHTARNRLPLFARKPAPVQVTWLGYPDTTGLKAMDYRLTDALADPPGTTEHLHTEQPIRLPDCAWCFQPSHHAPPVDVPPLHHSGHITFGCFNTLAKISAPLLGIWSDILLAVPGSHLLLKNLALREPSIRHRIQAVLGNVGIAPERIVFAGRAPNLADHLASYGRVDVALDTYPYHGTTTTCEALWMGVPVVVLAGKTHASRVGVSLLTNVGLPELIARDPEEYIHIATALAKDAPRLAALRASLRQHMASSPLVDALRFARNIEHAYRAMWYKWCEDRSSLP